MDFLARQVKAAKPFYLQISHYAGDGNMNAKPETYASVRRRVKPGDEKQVEQAAMTEDMDEAIGLLLAKMDALGLSNRTYVIYTADHGSKGHNGSLSGGKGTVMEGGIRVPLIVRGPGVVAGRCARVRASTVDILPTITALAAVKEPLPFEVEGGNLAPVLSGKGETIARSREDFVVHFPHYDKDDLGPSSILISGDDKLIRLYETGTLRLFNLATDRSERRDFSKEKPERVADLDKRLSAYLEAVHAQQAVPNPAYDPNAPVSPVLKQGPKKKDKERPGFQ
jgi:arylsulfatase A-like enzyme